MSMNTKRSHFLTAAVAAVSTLAFTARVEAQYSTVRLVPKEALVNEQAGGVPGSVAAGSTKLALGSPLAANPKAGGIFTGAVYLFDSKTGKQLPTLYPPSGDANSGMRFGSAVAICGKYLAVGAPNADDSVGNVADNRGAVYVFDINTLKLITKVQDLTFLQGEKWGTAVAVDRDQLVIGAPEADTSGTDSGGAALVDLLTGSFNTCIPVTAVDPIAAGDRYGAAVAIRNGIVAVGAPGATVQTESESGRVYLLDASGADLLLSQIDNPDATQTVPLDGTDDNFGQTVAFAGSQDILVGKPNDDDGVLTDAGSVVGVYVGDAYTPVVANTIYGQEKDDFYGKALACAQNLAFASAPGTDAPGALITDVGAVIMSGGASSLFIPGAVADGDQFGTAIAYADGILVASAPFDDTKAIDAGALWLIKAPKSGGLPIAAFALKGDTAPGSGVTAFSTFSAISTPQDDFGQPSYIAKITGTGTTGGKTQGVWGFDSNSNPLLYARTTTTAGTGLVKAGTITSMVNNVVGTVWYFGMQTTAGFKRGLFSNILNSGSNLWLAEGGVETSGTIAKIFDGRADNMTVAIAPGEYAVPFTYKVGTGTPVVDATKDSGIRFLSSGPAVTLLEGTTLAAGVNIGQFNPLITYNKTSVTYMHALAGVAITPTTNAAVSKDGVIMIQKDATATGITGAKFSTFIGATHSSGTNSMLVRATVTGGGTTAANNEGLWSNRTGSFDLVLRKGGTAPLMAATVVVKKIVGYFISSTDDILALVQIGGPGVTAANDMVLYVSLVGTSEPGTFEILLREGDRISGNDGAKVSTIQMLDFTSRTDLPGTNNYYGVLAALSNEKGGAVAATNLVWLVGDTALGSATEPSPRLPQVRLRKGVSAMGIVGKNTISSFTIPVKPLDTAGAGNTGLPHAVGAASGNSTLLVTYPDKSTGVISLTVPMETP